MNSGTSPVINREKNRAVARPKLTRRPSRSVTINPSAFFPTVPCQLELSSSA